MKKSAIFTIVLLIVMMLSISIIGYGATVNYSDYKEFLVNSHLVYNASYSPMFRPTKSGQGKIQLDCNSVIATGTLGIGVAIANSDGTLTSAVSSKFTQNVTNLTFYLDRAYYPELSASANYKAFLEPTNGLHLFFDNVKAYYR